MKKVVTTQVGADGVLTLTLPLAKADAHKTVRVTVETMEGANGLTTPVASREEWLAFIDATAGQWQGELERPPQGDFEKRLDLPYLPCQL